MEEQTLITESAVDNTINNKKTRLQRFYAWFSNLMPFQGANENIYWRVRALGASVGVGMIVLFFMVEIVIMGSLANKYGLLPSISHSAANIALVELEGEITTQTAADFIEEFDKIRNDDSIKSVILKINSGGGSPAGSDDIAHYLLDFQKDKKVYVYVQGIAASGAYYIASSVKPLNANPNAIVGSIGVILPHYSLANVAEKVGIEEDNVVAGAYKVPISLFKKVDDKGREYLSSNLLTPTYNNFKSFVEKARGLKTGQIDEFAEGKIFTASMPAIQGILVDKLTDYYSVKRLAVKDVLSANPELSDEDVEVVLTEITKKKQGGLFGIDFNVKGLEWLTGVSANASTGVVLK